ncbi:MAG: phosphatidate cytidylyltransferase [Clostridiales bacterium]|nr:phosphatidate cytidylyltransferase [Clostridiales bacterium]MDN5280894.1 phosphatidate cytidylyltransferase [Candidatus Ozemobacter sp.]
MFARIPVILIGIPAVYGLLVAAGDTARLVFLTIICLIGQYELASMLNKDFPFKPVPEWLAGIAILCSAHFFQLPGIIFSFAFSVVAMVVFTVLRGLRGDGYQRFALGLFSLIYLPFCLSFYLLLGKSMGGQLLFIMLASIWALDIGAYVFGMSIRGPKLSPRISPNKTISGAIGGALTCIAFFALVRHFSLITLTEPRFWALALSTAIIGQLADLFESVLKRESEIKDSGALLGAHGGILDRIDSILFLGPVCYALLVI